MRPRRCYAFISIAVTFGTVWWIVVFGRRECTDVNRCTKNSRDTPQAVNTLEKWKHIGENISSNTGYNFVITRNKTAWSVDDKVCQTNEIFPKAILRSPFGLNTTIFTYKQTTNTGTIAGQLWSYGVWDRYGVEAVYHALSVDKDLILIDIGANIGVFTLSAAMIGRKVIAIEPISSNVARLCKSIIAGDFMDNVYLIHNAVSDTRRTVTFTDDNYDHSLTKINIRSKNNQKSLSGYTIKLDDLLDVFPIKKAVIKMDVESHEARVLAGAERLFEQVEIPYVYLEWSHVKRTLDGQVLLEFMKKHQMQPFDVSKYYKPLHYKSNMSWPEAVFWRKIHVPV